IGVRPRVGARRLEGRARDHHARAGAHPRQQRGPRHRRATHSRAARVHRLREPPVSAARLVFVLADIPGVGIVKDALGGVTGWAFDKVAAGISKWVLGAVEFLRTSAKPDVEAAWFAGPGSPYAAVRNIAGLLLLGFVLLGLIQGLL